MSRLFIVGQQVIDFCEELYGNGVRSPFLLSFLIDLYQENCLNSQGDYNDGQSKELEQKIYELCNELITTHDTIRARYWEFILNKFKIKLQAKKEQTNSNSNHTN